MYRGSKSVQQCSLEIQMLVPKMYLYSLNTSQLKVIIYISNDQLLTTKDLLINQMSQQSIP